MTGPEPDRPWPSQAVRDAILRLSSREGVVVLAAVAMHKAPPALNGLVLFTRLPAETVRLMLADARVAGWVDLAERATPPVAGYVITDEGRTNLARLARLHTVDVNNADDTVIDGNDTVSSTTMTPVRDRRGRPDWCTPGKGVCQACKEQP